MRIKKRFSVVIIIFISLMIGALVGAALNLTELTEAEQGNINGEQGSINGEQQIDDRKAKQNNENSIYAQNIFSDIAEAAVPGIVKVTSKVKVDASQRFPFADPFFEDFYRTPEGEQPEFREGYGSGIIVSEDGYIVTNEHVIHNATEVTVNISGFEEPLLATVEWGEYDLDLAILKVDVNEKLTTVSLGDSNDIRPGDWAIAIGNPFDYEHTVTVGVISALGRPINIPTPEGTRSYRNLIQTDAAINPGNSGGPLLNIKGEAIGINTAVSLQGQGIGFAIPINEVTDYVTELKETGKIIRPWLGVYYQAVTDEARDYFNLPDKNGALVADVIADSPAENAGIQPYDVIIEIDRQPIEEATKLPEIINQLEIGQRTMIRVLRNGESKVLFATIGERPQEY